MVGSSTQLVGLALHSTRSPAALFFGFAWLRGAPTALAADSVRRLLKVGPLGWMGVDRHVAVHGCKNA